MYDVRTTRNRSAKFRGNSSRRPRCPTERKALWSMRDNIIEAQSPESSYEESKGEQRENPTLREKRGKKRGGLLRRRLRPLRDLGLARRVSYLTRSTALASGALLCRRLSSLLLWAPLPASGVSLSPCGALLPPPLLSSLVPALVGSPPLPPSLGVPAPLARPLHSGSQALCTRYWRESLWDSTHPIALLSFKSSG